MKYIALLLLLITAGCNSNHGPPLVLSELEVTRPVPGASMSAGYFLLENRSDETIEITRIQSPHFARVEIHETVLEDGISRMRRLPGLSIPANSSVQLERGGKHLMLMRPADELSKVALDFYSGDSLLLSAETTLAER